MNDDQLIKQKRAIAKLLPERIHLESYGDEVFFCWNDKFHHKNPDAHKILDTEWLQIAQDYLHQKVACDVEKSYMYRSTLKSICGNDFNSGKEKHSDSEFATFQQHCAALEAAGIIKV